MVELLSLHLDVLRLLAAPLDEVLPRPVRVLGPGSQGDELRAAVAGRVDGGGVRISLVLREGGEEPLPGGAGYLADGLFHDCLSRN